MQFGTSDSTVSNDSAVGSDEWSTLAIGLIVGSDSFFESDTIPGRQLKTSLISSFLVMDWTDTTRLSVIDR